MEKGEIIILGGQFDELSQKLDPFSQRVGQTDLGDDPILNFIKAPQKQIQIGLDLTEGLSSGDVIKQLVLDIN